IAIGREAHDLVLVGVEIETEVQSDQRVENADGIEGGDLVQLRHGSAGSGVDGGTMGFPHAVDDNDETFAEARGVGGAGGVGEMMIHRMKTILVESRQVASDAFEKSLARKDFAVHF